MNTEQVKPYRIISKIKNNRLWSAIREIFPSVETQNEAAEKLGISANALCAFLGMRVFPHSNKFGYSKCAKRIAEKLAYPVEYLFDPELYGLPPVKQIETEIGPRELEAMHLIALPPAPDDALDRKLMEQHVADVLSTLTRREENILIMRYGLDGNEERTNEQVAMHFGLSRERIRQIECAALRKLRHPSRARRLRMFVKDQEIPDMPTKMEDESGNDIPKTEPAIWDRISSKDGRVVKALRVYESDNKTKVVFGMTEHAREIE